MLPLQNLPEFLEEQQIIDEEEGKFYDKIAIRENGREMYSYYHTPVDQNGKKGNGELYTEYDRLNNFQDSAEELLMWLNVYKRHGILMGGNEESAFEYIQVCYIQFWDKN